MGGVKLVAGGMRALGLSVGALPPIPAATLFSRRAQQLKRAGAGISGREVEDAGYLTDGSARGLEADARGEGRQGWEEVEMRKVHC